MGNYFRKVSVDDLRPGMYIGDVFNQDGRLLYSADRIIDGYHQIEALRRQGVTTIFIPSRKESSQKSGSEAWESQPAIFTLEQYRQELDSVSDLKKECIEIVKSLISSAKTGRYSTVSSLHKSLEGIIVEALDKIDLFMALRIVLDNERIYNHSINVAVLMAGLAKSIGYSGEKVLDVAICGLLHDIGKVCLPVELTKKESLYTRLEAEIFRKHPQMGVELIKRLYRDVSPLNLSVIAQHHERLNGSGYPDQLKGDKINEVSLMCALADMYDSMTTDGFIKRALLPQEALALIFQGADEEYPRKLVEHFTRLLGIYPVGSFVKLESGEMGVVTKINRKSLLTPQIMLFFDGRGHRIDKPYVCDLSRMLVLGTADPQFRITGSLNPVQFNFNPHELIADKTMR